MYQMVQSTNGGWRSPYGWSLRRAVLMLAAAGVLVGVYALLGLVFYYA